MEKQFNDMKTLLLTIPLLAISNYTFAQTNIIENSSNACWQNDTIIKGKVSMHPQCQAKGGVIINDSNTHLNCNNSTIDIDRQTFTGIDIDSKGKPLSNIVIENCNIKNTKFQGIYIGWKGSDSDKITAVGKENIQNYTPNNVLIKNTKILTPGSSGIYIDDYVNNVILEKISIIDAPAMAIYFEFNSHHNKLINSIITGNGKTHKREAISIDSSQYNTIQGNYFDDNPYGSIFLYKNCSEHLGIDPKQVKRELPSNYNIISNNKIHNTKVGIWVASRQSMNLINARCGNGYYAEGKFTEDDAEQNIVSNNIIENAQHGVLVEDDNNIIKDNLLRNISNEPIRIGTPIRNKYLNRPVINSEVLNNKSDVTPTVIYKWGSN